jgi:glutamate-1-semialdehyde 2,1-aminomutase
MDKGTGQKLYDRAKQIIPGGNHLLSKRPELFLPDIWPSYYSKAKDCYVWDLDNNKFTDMSFMSVGTNSLGYANDSIDKYVIDSVTKGNLSTLNCPEEVELAEKLIDLHDWADMVRFARTGGEANAISIRIARAATGRDKIAICGYHGWHDWYIATNLNETDGLKNHLLNGISSAGVPKGLSNTVFPFNYNDIDALKKIITENTDLAAVKMEVVRSTEPKEGFLEEVRKLCSEYGIVLIFDECTSGFRETFGGIHKKYNVIPDMCMFGKALGNGYAITAVIGKEEIMQSVQDTFISSTFWTERIGPTAAIATLNEMEKSRSWEVITNTGKNIKQNWKKLAVENSLDIEITGIDALATFTIKSNNWLKYKTYITQEMLKKGYLTSNVIYASTKHSNVIVNNYFDHLSEVFKKIGEFERYSDIVDNHLDSKVCQSGFKRLN